MAYIKSFTDLNDNTYDIKSVITSAIPSGHVDPTSTSTAFTATVDGITELYDGVCVWLKNGVVTSAAGFTVNINGLGAKPVYSNLAAATRDTTIFNVNYTMLFVYDETRVSGGCWVCYRGYDANTNTIGYQLRTNNSTMPASDAGYRYRLWFTSADGQKWVPANTSTSTDATTSRTLNTRPIDPFGSIVYCSTNGTINSGAGVSSTAIWQQYNLTIGYSYVITLTQYDPVYLKCTPQNDGSAVMNTITQTLPSTNDGYIYIFLGIASSTTALELNVNHPVYWHDGTGIRIWNGAASSGGSVTVDSAISSTSENPVQNKVIYSALGGKQDSLTFDSTPTSASTNPVTSGGVYTALADKQDTLVSGTNIKTINNNSLLGSGNITIEGGGGGSTITTTTCTLTVAGWSNNAQTVNVTGVTASNTVLVTYAPASKSAYVAADIYCTAQGAGSLTFACTTTPTEAVTVNVMIIDGGGAVEYNITKSGIYGDYSVDKNTASEGETVTVTMPSIPAGKSGYSITVTGTQSSTVYYYETGLSESEQYSFSMPGEDITINV